MLGVGNNKVHLLLYFVTSLFFSIAAMAASEETTYYHTDVLGSVIAATDEAGEIVWRKTYDPFGREIISDSNGDEIEEQTYTGKPYDAETGLVYLGQRYYDPELRRFIGMDPVPFNLGNLESFNPYIYANNNPYKFVDPDGRQAVHGDLFYEGFRVARMSEAGMTDGEIARTQLREAATGLAAGSVLASGVSGAITCAASGVCKAVGSLGFTAFSLADPSSPVDAIPGGKVFRLAAKGTKALPSLQVPNAGGKIVSDVTKQDEVFFRVFSGDSTRGGFLTKVAPTSQRGAIEGLALPPGNSADFIQQVLVPAGTRLQRSRALPAFGRRGGKEQFQLLDEIPNGNFGPGVPFK